MIRDNTAQRPAGRASLACLGQHSALLGGDLQCRVMAESLVLLFPVLSAEQTPKGPLAKGW